METNSTITPEQFRAMDAKTKKAKAQKNMKKAMRFLKWKEEDIIDRFDLSEDQYNKRCTMNNWTSSEIKEVLSELGGDDKLRLYSPSFGE